MQKPTSAADQSSASALKLVIVTMDTHLASSVERARQRLARELPQLSISLHAASEYANNAAALARDGARGAGDTPIHVVVALAGALGRPAAPEDVSEAEWAAVMNGNATSAFNTAVAARPHMPRGASVVVVGSIASTLGYGTQAPYTAAKGALLPLVRSLALAWAPAGVRANAVLPGPCATAFTAAVLSSKRRVDATVAAIPAGRLGTPGDIVAPVLFLAGDGAAWVTGAALTVDGGGTARGMAPA